MLYASSASGLKEGLGSPHFAQDYYITTPDECSNKGFKQSIKQFKQEEIMTTDEIEKMEMQTIAGQMAGQSKTSAIADLPLAITEEATETLRKLHSGACESAIFFLDSKTETMNVESYGKYTLEDIAKRMPTKEPRYVLHKYTHEFESKQISPLLFLYYCPDVAMPRQKMTYSSCKSIAVKFCEKLGLVIHKQFEYSEIIELTNQALFVELYPKASEKKTFAKPKKPGKGKVKLTNNTKFSSASKDPKDNGTEGDGD